jgi:hypothetical protein
MGEGAATQPPFNVRAITAGGELWFAQRDVAGYLYRHYAYSGSDEVRRIAAEFEHPTSESTVDGGEQTQ